MMRNSKCSACPLCKSAKTICLPGIGPKNAQLMLVGEAPGKDEDQCGEPFIGKAGRLLTSILDRFGVDREDVYITNAVKCRPPSNRPPTKAEIIACRKYLSEEIKQVRPKLVVCLGVTALKSITQKFQMTVSKGREGKWKYFDAHVRATYHPASVFRSPYNLRLIEQDFGHFLSGKPKAKKKKRRMTLIDPKDIRMELLPYLTTKTIALDIETSGLDPFAENAKIWTIGFCAEPGESKVVPIYHREGGNKNPEATIRTISECLLENKKLTVIGHNIKFDLKWLMKFGAKVQCKIFDTMIAWNLIDENYPNKGLKHLAKRFTDMGDYAKEVVAARKDVKDHHYPLNQLSKYNGDDCDATYRLYKQFKTKLAEEGLSKQMFFNMQILRALIDIELNGLAVDRERLFELTQEYEKKEAKLSKELRKELGDTNLASPKQLADKFYKEMKYPIVKKTPKGGPSTDMEALKILAENHDCAPAAKIVEYRGITKYLSTYLVGMEGRIRDDGRVHTSFQLASNRQADDRGEKGGTVTGRLGSDLQQIPGEGGIKSIFISRYPRGRIFQADYSQIELRILAHFTQDKNLVDGFTSGDADIHRRTASRVYRKPESAVTSKERRNAKTVNFGIVYCIGPNHLSEELGTSLRAAQSFIRKWYNEYPNVERWIERQKIKVQRDGLVETLFGRKRRLVGGNTHTAVGRAILRQGVNAPIQGSASELTLFGMFLYNKYLKKHRAKSRVILNVHDSIIVDAPKDEIDYVEEDIKRIFENLPTERHFGIKLLVPTPMDVGSGETWEEAAK